MSIQATRTVTLWTTLNPQKTVSGHVVSMFCIARMWTSHGKSSRTGHICHICHMLITVLPGNFGSFQCFHVTLKESVLHLSHVETISWGSHRMWKVKTKTKNEIDQNNLLWKPNITHSGFITYKLCILATLERVFGTLTCKRLQFVRVILAARLSATWSYCTCLALHGDEMLNTPPWFCWFLQHNH